MLSRIAGTKFNENTFLGNVCVNCFNFVPLASLSGTTTQNAEKLGKVGTNEQNLPAPNTKTTKNK